MFVVVLGDIFVVVGAFFGFLLVICWFALACCFGVCGGLSWVVIGYCLGCWLLVCWLSGSCDIGV